MKILLNLAEEFVLSCSLSYLNILNCTKLTQNIFKNCYNFVSDEINLISHFSISAKRVKLRRLIIKGSVNFN